MRAGELRDRIIVQKPTETRDNLGDPVPTWTQYADRRCRVVTQSASEQFRNRQEAQSFTHLIEMRYLPGVRTKFRALWRRGEFAQLQATCSASGTTLYVDAATEFPSDAPYYALVGSEVVKVISGMGTTTWTVTRGAGGSTARLYGVDTLIHLLVVLDIEGVNHDGGESTILTCVEGEPGGNL